MKNKGRRHKASNGNCKGYLVYLTRPIESMGKNTDGLEGYSKRFIKSKWAKRVRGYFKSKTKELLNENIIGY